MLVSNPAYDRQPTQVRFSTLAVSSNQPQPGPARQMQFSTAKINE